MILIRLIFATFLNVGLFCKKSPCKISAANNSWDFTRTFFAEQVNIHKSCKKFLYFKFITCSSLFLATTYLLHLLAMIDAFAINCIGYETALLCQLQISEINIASKYHLDTLLHDETEINSNISPQDEYEENEGSLLFNESDSSPVLQQSFQIGNHVTFRSFSEIARYLFSRRCDSCIGI